MNQVTLKLLSNYDWKNIRLIASDMDGTLTQSEKFNYELLQTLERLKKAKIDVLIVTGRSAGWVQAIATYLPVVGAISENGGLFYWHQDPQPNFMADLNIDRHRQQLLTIFQLLLKDIPHLIESADNRFRLTDWTFDVAGLTPTEIAKIDRICQSAGYGFTYSTVQCHIKPLEQNKAIALNKVIAQHFPHLKPEEIVTIGDSPNDESLFNPRQFPVSVGVANILQYCDRLNYLPAYVTNQPEVAGFCELAQLILD